MPGQSGTQRPRRAHSLSPLLLTLLLPPRPLPLPLHPRPRSRGPVRGSRERLLTPQHQAKAAAADVPVPLLLTRGPGQRPPLSELHQPVPALAPWRRQSIPCEVRLRPVLEAPLPFDFDYFLRSCNLNNPSWPL